MRWYTRSSRCSHGTSGASAREQVGEQVLVHVLDDGEEQIVLGLEVVVDHADARAGVVGDAAQRGAVDALAQEALARGFDDAVRDVARRSRHGFTRASC